MVEEERVGHVFGWYSFGGGVNYSWLAVSDCDMACIRGEHHTRNGAVERFLRTREALRRGIELMTVCPNCNYADQ